MGNVRDALEGFYIELVFAFGLGIADSDRINGNAFLLGDFGCFDGWHATTVVVAVGENDKRPTLDLAVLEEFDGQANGVSKHRALTRHSDLGLVEKLQPSSMIFGKRHLQVGRGAKNDETESVFFAP